MTTRFPRYWRTGQPPGPRSTAIAPFTRCTSSGANRPIGGPIRSRRTEVILSTAIQDAVRKVNSAEGSILSRIAGASNGTDVRGQIVTLSRAPIRSDCTTTPGRRLPVKSPPRSAIATTRRASPGVVFIEGADILHPRHQIAVPIGGVDALALALYLGCEAGRARVRDPNLHGPQTAAAQAVAVTPGASGRRCRCCHVSHLTLVAAGVKTEIGAGAYTRLASGSAIQWVSPSHPSGWCWIWQEILGLVRVAESDQRAPRLCLSADRPRTGTLSRRPDPGARQYRPARSRVALPRATRSARYAPINPSRTICQLARSGAQIRPPVVCAGTYAEPSKCAL